MEEFPQPDNSQEESDDKERPSKAERLQLAQELHESKKVFSFPGLAPGVRKRLEAEESEISNYSDYATPVEELLEKFSDQGIKVVPGQNPDSGNIFVLPDGSNDIERDSLFPRHLRITEDMDERLKRLIRADKHKDL